MTQTNAKGRVSIVRELCRLLDSSDRAMRCAMSHRQVLVDGFPIHPRDEWRWTERQLKGRLARLHRREGRLFSHG